MTTISQMTYNELQVAASLLVYVHHMVGGGRDNAYNGRGAAKILRHSQVSGN